MIKVSIIIPVYNVAQYIERCLDSVSAQTYKGEIECILVDDCGPDNSLELCENYVNNYQGNIDYKILRREENGGLSVARNTGTEVATGDYLFYLDSDDEIPGNAIELLVAEVDEHPGIDVVMGFIDDDRNFFYYNLDRFKNHQYVSDQQWLQYMFFCESEIQVNAVSKLLRREFVVQNHLCFKEGIAHEDDHWMFFLIKYVKTWAFVFEPTYIRYWNEGTIKDTLHKHPESEALNWYKILLEFSDNLYGDFQKMQIYKCLLRYIGLHRYIMDTELDKHLHINLKRRILENKLFVSYLIFELLYILNQWGVKRIIGGVCCRLIRLLYRLECKRKKLLALS